jgi:hypothetical protein
MADIRPVDQIANKWAQVTPGRTQDFATGVQQPRRSWKAGATAANAAWKEGTQKAIQADRFMKGVGATTDQKWQQRTLQVGVDRWGPGVQASEDAYRTGFAPYAETIKATTLPPRYARRDPRNLQRVNAMVQALVARKNQIDGASA